jgi:glucose-1-phosphate thymidylyltransferase
LNKLHKSGVAEVDEEGRILSMEEKPANPKSHWCCPPFYFYKKEDLKMVDIGIAEGCETDAPGSFIAWLCARRVVHAWEMPGKRLDIGNLESYEEAKKTFAALKYGKD